MFEPKTLEEQIACLAQLTGAPKSFVLQVKELFSRKGIRLDSDAAPYLKALEEAFRREENIRTTTEKARNNIRKLQDNFNKIGKAYVRQLSELKKMRGTQVQSTCGTDETEIPGGDHRSFVTPSQRDEYPMVPGPKEKQ